ncbi:MAG: hypothetical protein AAFQ57_13715 [Cyanobacteria bacterium J06626_14]
MTDDKQQSDFDEHEFTRLGAKSRERWLREIASHTTIEGGYIEICNFLGNYLPQLETNILHLLD